MTEDDDNHKLGSFKAEDMGTLKPVLKGRLQLKFVDDPTNPGTIAHRIVGYEDEFAVMLLCSQLEDKTGYGIYLSGAGLHNPLVSQYQSEVAQALSGFEPL